jgi:hypothetical protein
MKTLNVRTARNSIQEIIVSEDDQATQQHIIAQDNQSLDYLRRSLSLSYVQQQIQSPAKAPVQDSGGQSGAGSSQSGSTSNK